MCDCDCRCQHIKAVRPRLTNTFIHTDIFNYSQPNPLNVKCEPIEGQSHVCKCNNIWQQPVVKDIRHRPRDHPNDHFYNQVKTSSTCQRCHHNSNTNEEFKQTEPAQQRPPEVLQSQTQYQTVPVKKSQVQYLYEEQLPAGNYLHTRVNSGGQRNTGYYPKAKGIHTGEVINYDRHQCHKDAWFNDAKEREIDQLNVQINRGYSSSRKRIDMASNAFDFIDDALQVPAANFRATKFDNHYCQTKHPLKQVSEYYSGNDKKQLRPKQEPLSQAEPSPKPQIQSKETAITPQQQHKVVSKPQPTGDQQPINKSQLPIKPTPVRPLQKLTKTTTVSKSSSTKPKQALQNKSSLLKGTTKCSCDCKCWQTRPIKK